MKVEEILNHALDEILCELCNQCEAAYYEDDINFYDCPTGGDFYARRCVKISEAYRIRDFFEFTVKPFLKEQMEESY